jgi:hypothetical protein
LVFEKNANFFAENWEKSQKIVIITSTPGWKKYQKFCSFRSGADLDDYGRLINRLKPLRQATQLEQKAILAYAILFQSDDLTLSRDGFELLDEIQTLGRILFDDCIRKISADVPTMKSVARTLIQGPILQNSHFG